MFYHCKFSFSSERIKVKLLTSMTCILQGRYIKYYLMLVQRLFAIPLKVNIGRSALKYIFIQTSSHKFRNFINYSRTSNIPRTFLLTEVHCSHDRLRWKYGSMRHSLAGISQVSPCFCFGFLNKIWDELINEFTYYLSRVN